MVSDEMVIWHFRYYAGNLRCFDKGFKSKGSHISGEWPYIIPFDKFNPNNFKESLKYNVAKNKETC